MTPKEYQKTQLRHFSLEEFNCTHTGNNEMSEVFLVKLDRLRGLCGFPFIITSGYRDPSHPIEAAKASPGTHSEGIAADIRITNSRQRFLLLHHAFALGFNGIGIANDFIHLDTRKATPVVWTY